MLSNTETQLLIGSLMIFGVGVASLVSALLVRRGHPSTIKWFGSSARVYVYTGVLATIFGLLNLVRFVIPDRLLSLYSTFYLAGTILCVVVVIILSFRDRRAR